MTDIFIRDRTFSNNASRITTKLSYLFDHNIGEWLYFTVRRPYGSSPMNDTLCISIRSTWISLLKTHGRHVMEVQYRSSHKLTAFSDLEVVLPNMKAFTSS